MSHQNYQQQGTEGILADLPTNQHQQVQNQIECRNQQHQRLMQQCGIGSGNAMSHSGSQQSKLLSNQLDGGIAAQWQYQNEQFNVLSLCRTGQETMQDIVGAVENVFNILREIEPPSDIDREVSVNDKRAELQEQLQTAGLLFMDLRFLMTNITKFASGT
ncbi:mediator of RNA polymerase II transcription subunit 30-like [Anopheles ziemanni]|uniref:mediator of RNA polymerase II transcription subunit 30-like n=1 Tax=Anopheles coustani TaxID=139045 RepID=UPI00265A34C6|nr:mediator of RNA polymerase II transcription subunit 30-like [Anopheles coustani]XP_058177500.1 mediator of RNA polymerase II transcription subunit 30-like [Anopheles ziemanni]